MKALIRTVAAVTFFRAGLGWPPEGRVIDTDELPEGALEAIIAEPLLRIEPAPTGAEEEAEATADLSERIRRAIAGLAPEDFDERGPKLAVVKAALPEDAKAIKAGLLSEIWAGLQPPPAA